MLSQTFQVNYYRRIRKKGVVHDCKYLKCYFSTWTALLTSSKSYHEPWRRIYKSDQKDQKTNHFNWFVSCSHIGIEGLKRENYFSFHSTLFPFLRRASFTFESRSRRRLATYKSTYKVTDLVQASNFTNLTHLGFKISDQKLTNC